MRTYVRLGLLLTAVLALAVLAGGRTPAYAWSYPAALNTNAATDSGGDYQPEVTTDGKGNWVAVWHSNENVSGTIGTDYDILVARSTDNGATWTAPIAVNTNAATDSREDAHPQVTTDGDGHWVAVWQSYENLGGTIGTDCDILVARSTNNGATWTDPAPLNTNADADSEGDYFPQVTTDGAGNWVAVWNSDENLGGTIGTEGDILVARSTDNGATWTDPAALNTNAASDSGGDLVPQVTTDGAGHWVAVWESLEKLGGTNTRLDWDILVARSTDNGATWSYPAALNTNAATDSGSEDRPQVTTDGAGNWVAVWNSDENLGGTIGTDSDILVARSTDNGVTWTAPAPLNANAASDSGGDLGPQVTTDGAGHWVAAWYSTDSLGGTIGTDYDILYASGDDASPISSVTVGTHAYAFGRDAGGSYWNRHWNGTSWEAWSDLGGVLSTSPSAVVAGGDVYVFGLDAGGGLWYRRFSSGSWGDWQGLGGILSGQVSGAATASNDVYVFGRDACGGYWYRHWNGTSWEAWSGLGGILSSSPSAVAAGGDVYVFGLDAGGGLWYQRRSGGSWGGWQALGGVLAGKPSAAAPGSNDVYVFGLGGDSGLWYRHRDAVSFGPWQGLGGILAD